MNIDNSFSERLKYSIIYGVKNDFSEMFYEHNIMAVIDILLCNFGRCLNVDWVGTEWSAITLNIDILVLRLRSYMLLVKNWTVIKC